MAHTNRLPTDYTHPLKRNGSFNTGMKQALLATFRSISGKNVQQGNATTVNASVVQTAATGLSFKVRKGKQYRIQGRLLVSTGATPGVAVGMSLAGSSAAVGQINYTYLAAAASLTQVVTSNPLASASTGGAAAYLEVDIEGYFIPDVSGTLIVTFAQNTSNASNTIVLAGSNVTVNRTFS